MLLRLEVMIVCLMFCRYYMYFLESSWFEIIVFYSFIIVICKEFFIVVRVKGYVVDRVRVWFVKVYIIVIFSGVLKYKDLLLWLCDKWFFR